MNTSKPRKNTLPHGLYGITAERFSAGRTNVEVARQMLAGGIRLIQYREKRPHKSFAAMLEECRAIRALTREAEADREAVRAMAAPAMREAMERG